MKKDIALTTLKGLWVGGTMTVPGISGGSMAMILGIYDKLIFSISSFFKHPKENILFLLQFTIGAIMGMVLFANPLLKLIRLYPLPVLFFFIGAVAGGIPLILKEAQIKKADLGIAAYPAMGILMVHILSLLPDGLFSGTSLNSPSGILMQVLAGFVISAALILPGISVSYMLLVLGMYESVMGAISGLHFLTLLPLASGLVLGILLTTHILEKAMTRHPQPTYLIILGFILGSLQEVFPGIPSGFQIPICILTILLGFFLIFFISKK